jgi:hypothetical protein
MTLSIPLRRTLACCALALMCVSRVAAGQQQTETLTGAVKSDSGGIIANAVVTATPAGAGATASVTTRSNSLGRWTIVMPSRSPDYFVTVSAIGWIQQRIDAKSNGGTAPVVVDATLKRAPVQLGPVRVTESRRPPPQREFLIGADIAGTEKGVLASSEVFAVADQGDLMGMISQVPGITVTSDATTGLPTFSALGLSGSQNNIVLNGLTYGGGDVPRDINGAVRVTATPYDVSRGGFSGAQLSVTQAPGSNFSQRLAHVTFDGPSLQFTDHVGRQLGQQYSNVQLSGNATGPIVLDRVFYNVSFQGGRRSSDLASLLTSDPSTLLRLGLSQDSVKQLMTAAQASGIPVSSGGIPSHRQTENGSVLARVDWTPSDAAQGSLVTSLRTNRSLASFVGPTAVPGHGGDVNRNGGDVTGQFSALIRSAVLNDLRFGAHADVTDATPYNELPDARVFVTSQLADGTTGLTSLLVGGNSSLPRNTRVSGAELFNQTSWNSIGGAHHWRATLNARLDHLSQNSGFDTRGTFQYNSIADLDANRPASFARAFVSHGVAADVQTGAVALGDQWQARDRLRVTYGLRLDGNRIPTSLAYNGAVDSVFHLRTDAAPSDAAVSPRASFQWGIGNNGTTGIPGYGAPWGFITGGFGEFRNDYRPGMITPVIANDGLSDGTAQLLCVGGAVPTPDYPTYMRDPSSIPTTCAGGTNPSFVSSQPNVWLIDPNFQSQRAWRGNLGLRGPFITKLFRFSADVTYSLNLHQQSAVDLNFVPTVRSQLPSEGNRPSFASTSSIVPATGQVTNVDSRFSPRFGSVNDLRSDLESRSTQYTFVLQPIGLSTQRVRWSASYTYAANREQTRGFGSTTAGNPLDVEWSPNGLGSRHAFNINLYTRVHDLFSVAVTGRAVSGTLYTPVVDGDINGDGLSNDRAFVFNPATASPGVASGMNSLLANASPRVRNCLAGQFGSIAKRNSCEGPWTATASASIVLNPQRLGWDNRTSISLNISNPLAGIDELLHGASHMQGWGQLANPDPTLLRVRGYDPTTASYIYDVNQRFGDTRLSTSSVRLPFIVSLEARVLLMSDQDHQGVDQIVGTGRTRAGTKLSGPQLRARLGNTVFNPLRGILQVKDSLSVLSQAQIDRLTLLQRRLQARQDTIWAPIVAYIDGLPEVYDREAVVVRVRDGRIAAYDAMVDAMVELAKILTPEQIADFPPALRSSFDLESLRANRPTKGFFPNY